MAASREVVIDIHQREWQKPLVKYFRAGGKRAHVTAHRRAGKDRIALFVELEQALQSPREIWHTLPEYAQARKVVWNAITRDGERLIDAAFPKGIVRRRNEQEMMIEFVNGSIWRLVGADNFDSLVGANPRHVTFSEFALTHAKAWEFVRPILAENDGTALFITTPRGYNHSYEMRQRAKDDPSWYVSTHPVSQTKLVPQEVLDGERASMPDELYRQEWECDYSAANVGAILGSRVEAAERDGRIGEFTYDPEQPVVLSSDIGFRDAAAFWFWQPRPDGFLLLDYDEESGLDADDWIDRLADRYTYGNVWLPHDSRAKTFATKRSAMERFKAAGYKVKLTPNTSISHRINAARMLMPQCHFAKAACERGLHVLRNWSYKWDDVRRVFSADPDHNEFSHGGDAFSYGSLVMRTTVQEKPVAPPPAVAAQAFTLDDLWEKRDDERRNAEWS